MIDLDKDNIDKVIRILNFYLPDCEVRVFGSRVRGRARKYSDLDLVLIGSQKIHWQQIEALKDAFSISDLPITVDVVDWHSLSDAFQAAIKEHSEILCQPVNHLDNS